MFELPISCDLVFFLVFFVFYLTLLYFSLFICRTGYECYLMKKVHHPLLLENFSQDPVKEYFSKHRCCGGANENSDVQEFNRNALGIDVAGDDFDMCYDRKYKRKGTQRC